MKKLLCYLKTLRHIDTFISAYMHGVLFINHDFVEVPSKDKTKQVLICRTCGEKSIGRLI